MSFSPDQDESWRASATEVAKTAGETRPATEGTAPGATGAAKPLSLDDPLLVNATHEAGTGDYYDSNPVPDGVYKIRLTLPEDGGINFYPDKTNPKQPQCYVTFKGKIENAAGHDPFVNLKGSYSTVKYEGKEISELETILNYIGHPMPTGTAFGRPMIAHITRAVGEKGALVEGIVKAAAWCGSCKKETLSGQLSFPARRDDQGKIVGYFGRTNKEVSVQCPKCGGEVNGSPKVVRFVGGA